MRRNRLSATAEPHDMTQRSGRESGKYYRIGAAAVAWFALVLQYYLTITKPGAPFIEATVRYFGFFTILTNILVAPRSDAALACAAIARRAVLRPALGAHRDPHLHHHRRGDLSLSARQAVEPARLAACRRHHRARGDARALCDRLGAVRAEGHAEIQIGLRRGSPFRSPMRRIP